jgi:hypothetical protein
MTTLGFDKGLQNDCLYIHFELQAKIRKPCQTEFTSGMALQSGQSHSILLNSIQLQKLILVAVPNLVGGTRRARLNSDAEFRFHELVM